MGGLVHGSWTNRWHKTQALEEAVAGLQHVPTRLGDWRGEILDRLRALIDRIAW